MIKFLIIRFSSIGDIVLTTPIIRNLKLQGECTEIHYLTKKQYAGILENNPYIDKLHLLDNSISEINYELRKEHFHYVIDLHRNLRTKRVKLGLRTISFEFNKLNWEKWLIVNLKINKLPDVHIVDRYLETVKFFIEENDNKGLDYFIPEKDEVNISDFPEKFKTEYIAFAIGAQHFTKKLPKEKIISICKKIDKPIILLGDKNDFEIAEEIKNNVGENILNACGKYNLNQSASIVKQSKLLITHDTGLMHIAAALKKKIISVWGNTIPEFGMYPYLADEDSEIVQVKGLKCRPCSKIGFKKCPKKHFKCMNDIDEERIVELCK
ncbi:MAG: glycosyltransferase family 9 protein [Bacteroidales bacterium]|nr:glycosyltransferase family 9 protein [Bacteroidales bacterium]MBN2756378.1 glycosyltransferase family 9 protein [Bacteroidales bacterium]